MGTRSPSTAEARDVLRRHFGHADFREGQAEIIAAVLAGRDCVAVLPTGRGKSLCFQLPALMRPGLTLVVSPLIALMKDQVDSLRAKRISATSINSSLDWQTMQERIAGLAAGRYRLVYVAPERFRDERFFRALQRVPIGLLAVDEAHCISFWGHDFRPDYLQLRAVLQRLDQPQVLALTATATPQVRWDIVDKLGLKPAGRPGPVVVVRGFARPGLTLMVRRVATHAEKLSRVLEILDSYPTGIVYCATRAHVEQAQTKLAARGIDCCAYHGGMADPQRKQAQERFLAGRVPLAVATNAFGMGIDRADLRCIVHWDIPGSLEAYYQEAGRAGRDGRAAHCEILFNYADVRTQEALIEGPNEQHDRSNLRRLLRYVDTRECRHAFILRHFGDPEHERTHDCNRCDNCLRRAGADGRKRRAPTDLEWTQIQKVLGCAAHLRGGYGRARVAQVLAGSRDRNLLRTGLQTQPVYGTLAELPLGRIRTLIDALIDAACLQTVGDEYPTLRITPRGRVLLQRKEPFELILPDAQTARGEPPTKRPPRRDTPQPGSAQPEPPTPPGSIHAPLFDALRALRTELANKRGIPAFRIYSNATLAALTHAAPRNQEQLLAVKGIGPAKAADFGQAIVQIVCRLVSGSAIPSQDGSPTAKTD